MDVEKAEYFNRRYARHVEKQERTCPKCGAVSGDNWNQCEGRCPMSMSPHFVEPA
jgi:ribosomal protein S27AE